MDNGTQTLKVHSRYILSLVFGLMLTSCDPPMPVVPDPSGFETTPYAFEVPSYFPPVPEPEENPTTEEGVRLGRYLFYEKKLSADNSLSCGGCHFAENGFSDPRQFSPGIDNISGDRNAMAIINLAFQQRFFWDGRKLEMETQALEPIPNPIEMHQSWGDAVAKIQADTLYPPLFRKAFGTEKVTVDRIVKAIAQFERTMISSNSKFDRFLQGQEPLTPSELRGYDLFNSEAGDCFHCHGDISSGFQFSDGLFHNNGLDSVFTDLGLFNITGLESDKGKFKSTTLRNIEYTAPYMHDGRFSTLEEVIDHYDMGGHPSATLDPNMKAVGVGRNWTSQQKEDLVNFLKALSDPSFISNPAFSNPHEE